jgi:DNA replication protein DnaC
MDKKSQDLIDEQMFRQQGSTAAHDAAARSPQTPQVGTSGTHDQKLTSYEQSLIANMSALYPSYTPIDTIDPEAIRRRKTASEQETVAYCPGDACGGIIKIPGDYRGLVIQEPHICRVHSARWLADMQQLQIDAWALKGGLPARFAKMSLDTYPAEQDPAAVQAIRDWIDSGVSAVILMGNYGRGKSGLAAGATREILRRGRISVQWANAAALAQDLYNDDAYLQRLKTCKLLILDDLGAGRNDSRWVLDLTYAIVNHRHDHALRTIYTTNFRIAERVDAAKLAQARAQGSETLADRIGQRTVERLLERQYTTAIIVRGRNLRM